MKAVMVHEFLGEMHWECWECGTTLEERAYGQPACRRTFLRHPAKREVSAGWFKTREETIDCPHAGKDFDIPTTVLMHKP